MSRIPRSRLGTGVFHVINRGINRQWIFESDKDKDFFLELLAAQSRNFQVSIYHWAIMSNHYHLAAEFLKAEDISGYFSKIQSLYCRYSHKDRGGSGTLWQGRFKSVVVQKEDYLNQLGRYIELSPVRAGIVGAAWDYKWSSARAYALGEPDPLVAPPCHPYWENWGANNAQRRQAHVDYLLDVAEADEQSKTFRAQATVIGDDDFRANLRSRQGRLIARKPGRRSK